MKLVVGLGNPGRKYERTRHNLGFYVIDHIASRNRVQVTTRRSHALVGEWVTQQVVLAKPQTYMNRSGESVRGLMREFCLTAEDMVVVHDDLDLPFGRIRIRPKGGAGGHRGVASIIESLAGASFYRVRIGIGRPPAGIDPADYVLQRFSDEEEMSLDDIIARASEATICLLREGKERAMAQFNAAT